MLSLKAPYPPAMDASGLMSPENLHKCKHQNDVVIAEEVITEKYTFTGTFEPSSLSAKFSDVKAKLLELSQSINPKNIAEHCSLLRASNQADTPLFLVDYLDTLKESKSTPNLLQKLSPFTNWIDHSILSTIVEVCNLSKGSTLLSEFDARIDPSHPLKMYPVPSPSYLMVPYDTSTHTILAVQLNSQLQYLTLQSVLDTRSLIQEKCKITPHCLQLLAIAKTGHTIIYWTIPKHVATLITSNLLQYQTHLHQNGVEMAAIYPGTTIFTNHTLIMGPFSSFIKVSSTAKSVYYTT